MVDISDISPIDFVCKMHLNPGHNDFANVMRTHTTPSRGQGISHKSQGAPRTRVSFTNTMNHRLLAVLLALLLASHGCLSEEDRVGSNAEAVRAQRLVKERRNGIEAPASNQEDIPVKRYLRENNIYGGQQATPGEYEFMVHGRGCGASLVAKVRQNVPVCLPTVSSDLPFIVLGCRLDGCTLQVRVHRLSVCGSLSRQVSGRRRRTTGHCRHSPPPPKV